MRFPLILALVGLAGCSVFAPPPSGSDDPDAGGEDISEDLPVEQDRDQGEAEDDMNVVQPDVSIDLVADVLTSTDASNDTSDLVESVDAPDWTAAFIAVYQFEGQDLGEDSSPNALNLQPLGTPTSDIGHVGNGADLKPSDALATNDPMFNDFSVGLTFGGWIKVRSLPTEELDMIATYEATDMGVSVSMSAGGTVDCWVGDGVDWTSASSVGRWGFDAWHHVVCTFDGANNVVSGFVDSVLIDTQTITIVPSVDDRFTVGTAVQTFQLDGVVDETFAYRGVLTAEQIERIRACGIDGTSCRCDMADPTTYVSCGVPDCTTLPACNADL